MGDTLLYHQRQFTHANGEIKMTCGLHALNNAVGKELFSGVDFEDDGNALQFEGWHGMQLQDAARKHGLSVTSVPSHFLPFVEASVLSCVWTAVLLMIDKHWITIRCINENQRHYILHDSMKASASTMTAAEVAAKVNDVFSRRGTVMWLFPDGFDQHEYVSQNRIRTRSRKVSSTLLREDNGFLPTSTSFQVDDNLRIRQRAVSSLKRKGDSLETPSSSPEVDGTLHFSANRSRAVPPSRAVRRHDVEAAVEANVCPVQPRPRRTRYIRGSPASTSCNLDCACSVNEPEATDDSNEAGPSHGSVEPFKSKPSVRELLEETFEEVAEDEKLKEEVTRSVNEAWNNDFGHYFPNLYEGVHDSNSNPNLCSKLNCV